ncbi:hypothetical protein [Granulicella pectinivorans]|uniref:hypothetical protein n=1 Tax=Granulicella pectinivorans TaxID=474950 RepID=UPI0011406BD9|nr:hypothetical protein [Granulicella pectinivorans]
MGTVLALGLGVGVAQPKAAPVPVAVISQDQMADTQSALIKLLRMSPMLTEVVERDPSLLADQAYVSRTNPQLADFLTQHPEVARNPEFYLFNGIEGRAGHRHEVLDRKIWPELDSRPESPMALMVSQSLVPFMVFLCILAALIWLLRVFMENRRWNRAIKLQVDAHGKLIERFSSNQELLVYMETDAGKKFLEAGPVPVDFGQTQRIPSAVGRVLTPLQIGVVMTLLGAGFLMLRNSVRNGHPVFLVAGIVVLMPGLGFIISAGLTWLLAGRLGMIPSASNTQDRM